MHLTSVAQMKGRTLSIVLRNAKLPFLTDARSDWPKFCETSVRFQEQKAGARSDRTKKREHFAGYGEELSNSPKKVMLVTEMKERTLAPIAILPSVTQMKC